MHLTNEMLTLLPPNGISTSTVASTSSMTSPTMSCIPAGQISAFSFNGIPGANISCLQTCATGLNGLNGMAIGTLNGVQTPFNGYNMSGIPTNYTLTANGVAVNGLNSVNVSPVTTCASSACGVNTTYNGLTINGVPFVPPTALTSPEVYGLPPPSMTTTTKSVPSTDSSSSGETSPAPLSPAASSSEINSSKLEVMRLTTTPTALTLPPLTALSLPSVPNLPPINTDTPMIYYTQPPLGSPAITSAVTPVTQVRPVTPTLNPGLNPVISPVSSPGVSPTTLPPGMAVPDIMHLINYGDKDLGLLLSQRMELVWHGEFDRLFSQYFPHIWCLVPTFAPPSENWRTFKDSAKVRFSCQDCGHGWTSMKGRVVFWFELNFGTNSGCVMFKLYGQQCQRCKTGKFEHAMWYPEEVVKVIGNVYNRVGQIYYGFVRPPLRIDRRVGKPRNQHNAELCQACKEGLCKEEWSFA